MSINAITIDQLNLACRHVEEMMAAGVTENMAIRTLEMFANGYANLLMGGNASPHHVTQVDLWSVKAKKLRMKMPDGKPKDLFRVEHGTPRRAFARKVITLYKKGKLNETSMQKVVKRYWRLAVVTLEEDQCLNRVARSRMFGTPEKRWSAAGIKF